MTQRICLNSSQPDNLGSLTHRVQNSIFRTLERFAPNVDDCPIEQSLVLFRRQGNDLHYFGVSSQQESPLFTILFFVIHRYDEQRRV